MIKKKNKHLANNALQVFNQFKNLKLRPLCRRVCATAPAPRGVGVPLEGRSESDLLDAACLKGLTLPPAPCSPLERYSAQHTAGCQAWALPVPGGWLYPSEGPAPRDGGPGGRLGTSLAADPSGPPLWLRPGCPLRVSTRAPHSFLQPEPRDFQLRPTPRSRARLAARVPATSPTSLQGESKRLLVSCLGPRPTRTGRAPPAQGSARAALKPARLCYNAKFKSGQT